ncbi:single-stranded DNA-binding protein [Methylobacter psychrophilus]|uniref:single-stranded DNA-binding protein n=1 Tax=Methylobacter psychrophilus TaxID=96941 RepID=UPI0021D4D3A5|nr:single-stranded DNA-binding protein [Methylobacter psychrophilus]
MIDALIAGKLIKTPELRTGKTGNHFTQFLLAVATGEDQPTIISGIAFADTAEKIARLQKGDSLAVIGSLKPTEWIDKNTGETKHGLSIVTNNSLSPYDIKKRKSTPKPDAAGNPATGNNPHPYDDKINF